MDFRVVAFFLLISLLFTAAVSGAGKEAQAKGGRRKILTREETERLQKLWDEYGPDYSARHDQASQNFPCDPLPPSASVPTSVHQLRPGDIKVIGAMGDSLTAGTGIEATNIVMVLTQNRGLSWSGGGETSFEDQISLPNILKKYNPKLYGYATGDGDEDSWTSRFNVAVAGSTSSALAAQAQELVLRMRGDPNVNFEEDWKVVTILSGNNDLCDFCNQRDKINREEFYEHLTAALDILHAELPRTLVNLVEPLNMEIVTELNKGVLCSTLHYLLCDCAAFPADPEAEAELIHEADVYQRAVEEIAMSGRYDTRQDFTVVVQPFFNATYLPRKEDGQPDMSYFAPDCFHLSRLGQAAAASALWNNMIEPLNSKRTQWAPGEDIECPSQTHPFFYTNKNSLDQGDSNLTFQPRPQPRRRTADDHTGHGSEGWQGWTEDQQPEGPSSRQRASFLLAVGACGGILVLTLVGALLLTLRRYRPHAHSGYRLV